MLNRNRKSVFLSATLLLAAVILPSLVWAQSDAAAAIASAKEQIVTCYQAVKEAEAAGANVTSLTTVLNDAGALLSRAESAYAARDFNAARSFAVQSREKLANCVSEANALKTTATQQQNQDFMINVVGSTVGAFAVLGAGAAIWFFFRKRYAQSGVSANESSGV